MGVNTVAAADGEGRIFAGSLGRRVSSGTVLVATWCSILAGLALCPLTNAGALRLGGDGILRRPEGRAGAGGKFRTADLLARQLRGVIVGGDCCEAAHGTLCRAQSISSMSLLLRGGAGGEDTTDGEQGAEKSTPRRRGRPAAASRGGRGAARGSKRSRSQQQDAEESGGGASEVAPAGHGGRGGGRKSKRSASAQQDTTATSGSGSGASIANETQPTEEAGTPQEIYLFIVCVGVCVCE